MAIIPQVKCSRCDRKYSGLRTRCPYCGARRYVRSQRAAQEDNSMWKVVVGVLLLVVLIAAVVVLIVTSANDTPSTTPKTNETTTPSTNEPTSVTKDPDTTTPVTNDEPTTGNEPTVTDEPTTSDEPVNTPTTSDVPKPMVNTIMITYNNRQAGQWNSTESLYEITMKAGESLPLGVAVTPQGIDAEIVWESDNEGVVAVLQNGKVTAVGKGTCKISASADDVKAELMIRVRG